MFWWWLAVVVAMVVAADKVAVGAAAAAEVFGVIAMTIGRLAVGDVLLEQNDLSFLFHNKYTFMKKNEKMTALDQAYLSQYLNF